ncbi:lysophospholipid acyltransferase family protein [Rhodobium gokarnense]|uniref:Lysophospholipid acyltransferase (LPLAT)-like uncharacterized protein n=1 Tax=Rhodobium gokarnense TaxID=364296 RepID=A0ABT3HCP9_9HYPH|nr:lysophospholipid acyltransferase family protein [Rhodobium gokarnense]MCW2308175.1 lysophospholipid acyltransferase (LPLAT)-like uncharacterized protein [Rhodobium gokarnense]
MLKRVVKSEAFRRLIGNTLAAYLDFVDRTSTLIIEPEDIDGYYHAVVPNIVTMWHGQHFLMPFARPTNADIRVMISKSGDGDINAIAAKKLGMGLIRASGGKTARQISRRGGVRGFLEALRCLENGVSVSLTADVPKGPARVCGPGIVQLASRSGRPILPTGYATSRRITLDTWDRMAVNVPFSRCGFVAGDPIFVPSNLDEAGLKRECERVKAGLDAVIKRAYAIADETTD